MRSIQVLPHGSVSSRSDSSTSCESVDDRKLQWKPPFRSPSAHQFLKLVAAAVLGGSCINIAWSAFLFGQVLKPSGLGSSESNPPAGYASWTDCNCTLNASETPLGALLSLDFVRAVVSSSTLVAMGIGQFFLCSLSLSSGRRICVSTLGQLVLVCLAVGAIAALPADAPFIELPTQGLLSTWMFTCIVYFDLDPGSPRTSRTATCAFFFTMFLGLICIMSLNVLVQAKSLNAVLIYGGALFMHKAVEILFRIALKHVNFLPPEVCAFTLLGYQATGQMIMRRHTLGLETVEEVILAGAFQWVTEVVQSFCGAAAMVWFFNATVEANPHQAFRVLKVGAYGVLADLACEHVAMQTALGYALFVDNRVFALDLQKGTGESLRNAAILLVFELLADTVVLLVLLGLLPRNTGLLDISPQQGTARMQQCGVFLSLCMWMCTSGLSALTREELFSCSGVC